MRVRTLRWLAIPTLTLALLVLSSGCNKDASDGASDGTTIGVDDHASHDHAEAEEGGHNLGGWWCSEHGVPEAECSLCSATAAAKFKEKGDWCEEHNRAESQCFICNPEQAEKFAKLYEAKTGEKPPKPAQ